jgi:hypothetical protein
MSDLIVVGYDSTTPSNIPLSATLIFYYMNGRYAWSAADQARFTNAVTKLSISINATGRANVLDIENYDANPEDAPGWLDNYAIPGPDGKPWLYMNSSTWPTVIPYVGTRPVNYWVAQYNGDESIPSTPAQAAGRQFEDFNDLYDISNIYASALGTSPVPPITKGDPMGSASEFYRTTASTPNGLAEGSIIAVELNAATGNLYVKNDPPATAPDKNANQLVPGQYIAGTLDLKPNSSGTGIEGVVQRQPAGLTYINIPGTLKADGTVNVGIDNMA